MDQEIFRRELIGKWEIVSEERLILQRAIVPDRAYEMLKVTKEDQETYKLLHELIFCENYTTRELERVLSAFGYQSLEEFEADCKMSGEKQESESKSMDWGTLSMFICDTHEDGILMEKDEAIKETKRITEFDIYLE